MGIAQVTDLDHFVFPYGDILLVSVRRASAPSGLCVSIRCGPLRRCFNCSRRSASSAGALSPLIVYFPLLSMVAETATCGDIDGFSNVKGRWARERVYHPATGRVDQPFKVPTTEKAMKIRTAWTSWPF
jgi:hypothetical protein